MKLSHFALAGLFLLVGSGIYLTMKTEMDGRMEELKAEHEQKFQKYERAQKEQAALIAKNADELKEKARLEERARLEQRAKLEAAAPGSDTARTAAAGPAKSGIPRTAGAAPEEIIDLAPKKYNPKTEPAEVADAPPQDLLPPAPGPAATPGEAAIQEREQNILNDPGIAAERMALERGKITGAIPEGQKLNRVQSLVVSAPAIARVKEVKEADGFVVLDRGKNANLAKGDKFSVRRGTFILGPITIADTIEANQCIADVGKLVEGAVLQKGDEVIQWNPQNR